MYSQRQYKILNHTNGICTSILDPVINKYNLLKLDLFSPNICIVL